MPGAVADPTDLFSEFEVNLNSTSPVENCGLPATLGSGKWNLPFALPTASVIIAVPCTRVDAAGSAPLSVWSAKG